MPIGTYYDLGHPDEQALLDAPPVDATEEEDPDVDLAELQDDDEQDAIDPQTRAEIRELIEKVIIFCEELSDLELRPYQRQLAFRIIESIVLGDAETITALQSRQSGKSETIATVVAGIIVLFPKLAKAMPLFERFRRGVFVGAFAPVDNQSDFVYGRIKGKLTSPHARKILDDPEIDEPKVKDGSRLLRLSSGSFVRRTTANARAKIEGDSLHVALIDESQDVDDTVVNKSIMPMLAAYAGTTVMVGTPGFHKGVFYKNIQYNKRRATKRNGVQNHFEFDWKVVAKYNPYYAKFIQKEKLRLGEDSDEFQMSYCLKWQLDRGMFITEDELDILALKDMQRVRSWRRTPCVAGIDVARTKDATVVTVGWVDWEHPDAYGLCEVRVLDWLEIHNAAWEEQYFEIYDFLMNYNLAFVGVDSQGMGSAVAERLGLMLAGHCEVIPVGSDLKAQNDRWKHTTRLLQRRMLLYPGHSKARRTKCWKRFRQQMEDAEKKIQGQYLLVAAPDDDKSANDDYVDSLAIMCAMTIEQMVPQVEVTEAPFYGR